jgi:hypothetical protein
MLRFVFILFFGLFSYGEASLARPIPVPTQVPTDFAPQDIDVELYTVGLGPELYMRYGHTLLGFHIKPTGQRLIYNWGMFDFGDPFFPINFYLGKRTYWVGQSSLDGVIKLYKEYEDRNVWRDVVNLNDQQKTKLIQLVNEKLTKENMFFGYEHFERNCATIPRDLIDEAIGNQLSSRLKTEPATHDFRWYVRTHMGIVPYLGWILDIAMNQKLDVPQSKWEESFYPLKLREYLSSLPANLDDGAQSNGAGLLQFDKQLVVASSDWFAPDPDFYIGMFLFMLATSLLILFFPKTWLIGGTAIIFGGVFGLIGFSMIISWLFSTHFDMHHNLNMLLFFPMDLLLIFIPRLKNRAWFKKYISCHWGLLALHGGILLLGFTGQNANRAFLIGLVYVLWMSVASGWVSFKYKRLEFNM